VSLFLFFHRSPALSSCSWDVQFTLLDFVLVVARTFSDHLHSFLSSLQRNTGNAGNAGHSCRLRCKDGIGGFWRGTDGKNRLHEQRSEVARALGRDEGIKNEWLVQSPLVGLRSKRRSQQGNTVNCGLYSVKYVGKTRLVMCWQSQVPPLHIEVAPLLHISCATRCAPHFS
jgi:hypothetical protein